MGGKWLFDSGAGISCMLSQQFRLIPIEKRPTKLNQQEARGASGTALIPDGVYLFPMQWNGKSVMQTVTTCSRICHHHWFLVSMQLTIKASHISQGPRVSSSKTIWTRKDFQKANFKIFSTLKIPAHTGLPVRLGTTLGNNQEPMPGDVQAVSTIASMEFPYLFAQPGLVSPDLLGHVMIILQNCGDEDVIFSISQQMQNFQNQNPCCMRRRNFF